MYIRPQLTLRQYFRPVTCCLQCNNFPTMHKTIHAPGCVDLPVLVTASTPGAVPWVTPPPSMRMAMTCVCRPMMGTPFWRGIPASLALLKAASRAAAFANRDGFVGAASPTGPASAHRHHMSVIQTYKGFVVTRAAVAATPAHFMHHDIVIQLLFIPSCMVAGPAARANLV